MLAQVHKSSSSRGGLASDEKRDASFAPGVEPFAKVPRKKVLLSLLPRFVIVVATLSYFVYFRGHTW